ncbi:MAG: hypothetical protein ACKV2O_04790 [Acidimicrobiales bacterium]
MLQLTVADTAWLLLGASTIGVVDVFWFHHYRFRLFRQPSATAEEAIHLLSYATFVGLGVALLAVGDGHGHGPVLALFGVQLVLTAADVLLEPRSRAPLGGLPALEYLFHVLVTFGIGGAAATFWWSNRAGTVPALDGMALTQVQVSVGFTALLLAVESSLYLRAMATRRRNALNWPGVATAR